MGHIGSESSAFSILHGLVKKFDIKYVLETKIYLDEKLRKKTANHHHKLNTMHTVTYSISSSKDQK